MEESIHGVSYVLDDKCHLGDPTNLELFSTMVGFTDIIHDTSQAFSILLWNHIYLKPVNMTFHFHPLEATKNLKKLK